MLHRFVTESEKYFGVQTMSFNLYQILHICKSISSFGPLWAHSTFGFESANHFLLEAIKCARGVPQQIVWYVHINHSATIMQEKIYQDTSNIVKLYCDSILSGKMISANKISKIYNCSRFQNVSIKQLRINACMPYF